MKYKFYNLENDEKLICVMYKYITKVINNWNKNTKKITDLDTYDILFK